LLTRQEAFVRKVLKEIDEYDNLYYEICNEPYNEVTDTAAVDQWHTHMAALIKETEAGLPKKHLIASNESIVENQSVSIANYHYVKVRNMPDFDWLFSLNKVLSMDETQGSLHHSGISDVRVEAWDFIFRGGGAYDNLSWEYTVDNPRGTKAAQVIRMQLGNLKKFMGGIDYLRMLPDKNVVIEKPDSCFVRVLSEKGKNYAIYLHHSRQKGTDFIVGYEALQKKFQDSLVLDLPAGKYRIEFSNPSTGRLMSIVKPGNSKAGSTTIITPVFTTDIAIRIIYDNR